MRNVLALRKVAFFSIAALISISLLACEVAVTSFGEGTIQFCPGFKEWKTQKPLNFVNDDIMIIAGFGKTIWQGATPEQVKEYNLSLNASYFSVRNVDPDKDPGADLKNIWTAFNKKWVEKGIIYSMVHGWCVVDYNWTLIDPLAIKYTNNKYQFRLVVSSTPISGKPGEYLDALEMKILVEGGWNSYDKKIITIKVSDTDTIDAVNIQRL